VLRAEAENSAILLTNLDIQDPEDLVPVLQAAVDAGHKALVIVARNLSDAAMALLMRNRRSGEGVDLRRQIPGPGSDDEADGLTDMAHLTGATPILGDAKQTLYDVHPPLISVGHDWPGPTTSISGSSAGVATRRRCAGTSAICVGLSAH